MTGPDIPQAVAPPPETLDELYEHAPCGYLTTRPDGIVIRVNATMLALLGETRATLLGRPLSTILTPSACIYYQTYYAPLLSLHGVLDGVSIDLACAGGEQVPALMNWRRVDDAAGALLGYRVTVVKAAERAAHEHELLIERERTRQQEELAQALNAELEHQVAARTAALVQSQKMESLGQLTGGVAHDFNNLLTPILITLDLLHSRYISDERALRMTASALSAAERARVLVARLLAFARRQHLKPQAVDLGRLIESMTEVISRSIGSRIVLRVGLTANLPPARVDPGQLEVALLDLCINARDAMPEGGTLTISAEIVSIKQETHGAPTAGRYVRLSVIDTGTGMSADTLHRAAEPFYSTKGVGKGTGLGLSMVHGFAAQSGGQLVLESVPGHGTTACIWLPVDQTAAPAAEATVTPQDGAPARPLSILLVDDDELVRFATGEMLVDLGHSIIHAPSGTAALEALRPHASVDLVITDYLMPNMTGVELARFARMAQPDLPVLLITGYANINEVDGGGLPRLAKPFSTGDLSNMIAETLAGAGLPPSPSTVAVLEPVQDPQLGAGA